ncbi:818_t:CDS:2 [Funneliformis mosseae]|uniref:818_t:CDS:1 n=1 Tax=Funneliformis mosseae TaxID=27381 RepID=A0A9N8VHX5_FUNMO|nr:818_t:CDS:2 [Funneliformis mosseae]
MTKQPGNDTCADCGVKGPRWASHNLGLFLCIRCGGLHRKMGTHISKVKSISLDSWTPEQIENMRQWGNLKANAKWNPRPEFHPVPVNASDSEMERYIRNKYEKQIYRENPDKQSTHLSSVAPPSTPPRRPTNNSILKYNNERRNHDLALRQLKEMGFDDNTRNREVLDTTNGDLGATIEILCKLSKRSANDKLTQLWNLGFQDETKNRDALRRTGGNVEVAAALLLEARNPVNNNSSKVNSASHNPIATSQTEKQRMHVKLPVSQPSQSLLDSPSSQQISFQQSQITAQNSSQNLWNSFGSQGTGLLNLFTPQKSPSNVFSSMNNGTQLRPVSSGFGQNQNQFSQVNQFTQQNLTDIGGNGFNSNKPFGNMRPPISGSNGMNGMGNPDLLGINFNTNNSNTHNNVLTTNGNSYGGIMQQQNSMITPRMMPDRQHSLPNFGNVSTFTNNTPGFGGEFGQLQQQVTTSNFAMQQQRTSSV